MKPLVYLVLWSLMPTSRPLPGFDLMTPTFTGLPTIAVLTHPQYEPLFRNKLGDYFTFREPTSADWHTAMVARNGRPLNMPLDHIMKKTERQPWLL